MEVELDTLPLGLSEDIAELARLSLRDRELDWLPLLLREGVSESLLL